MYMHTHVSFSSLGELAGNVRKKMTKVKHTIGWPDIRICYISNWTCRLRVENKGSSRRKTSGETMGMEGIA